MSELVTVVIWPSPFRQERRVVELAPGPALSDVVAATGLEPRDLAVRVRGELVEPAEWAARDLVEGDHVSIVRRPAVGPPNLWAMLALDRIGYTFKQQLSGVYGTWQFLRSVPSMLFPQFNYETNQGAFGRRFTIQGARNTVRAYERTLFAVGRVQCTPDQAAMTYIRESGGKVYQMSLLTFGPGELEISDIKFGKDPVLKAGTAISYTTVMNADTDRWPNVRLEVRKGGASDAALTLYKADFEQVPVAKRLKKALGWVTRRTPPETNHFEVIIGFPNGLFYARDDGSITKTTVRVEIEYRSATSTGQWYAGGVLVCEGKTKDSKFFSKVVATTAGGAITSGTWDVRCRRVSEEGLDSGVSDVTNWEMLTIARDAAPVAVSGMSYLALEIELSDNTGGRVIDDVTAVVTRRCKDYDSGTGTWVTRATSNVASNYLAVLQHPRNSQAVADARVDLPALAAWHAEAWTCGLVLQGQKVGEALSAIAAAGRALPDLVDGRYTVLRETAAGAPTFYLTPTNSTVRSFRGMRTFLDPLHGLRVQFTSPDDGWLETERVVPDDGYTEATASEVERLEIPGVIDKDQAWRLGRYHLARRRLRPEQWEVEADFEILERNVRGDHGLFLHDVPMIGIASGRITAVEVNGSGACTAVTLLEVCTMTGGGSYGVRIRKASGADIDKAVTTVAGEQTTLTFATPIASGEPQPAVGDLLLFGERGVEAEQVRIVELEPVGEDRVRVLLEPSAPGVLTAATGTIPAYKPRITTPPAGSAAAQPQARIAAVKAAAATPGEARGASSTRGLTLTLGGSSSGASK